MDGAYEVKISATELPQYVRFVQFASEVTQHAAETDDEVLLGITERLADDLEAMYEVPED